MNYAKIKYPQGRKLFAEVNLPGSKSISNRVLIIQKLCKDKFNIENLSNASDTQRLDNLLNAADSTLDVADCGTAMRFLTAYLSVKDGTKILTGTERMQKRPIGGLVDSLKKLGAEIDYVSKSGYPPLRIKGKKLKTENVVIDASVSSQFISALLMIAPTFITDVLTIEPADDIVSKPYINMTMSVMRQFGIQTEWNKNFIEVFPSSYSISNLKNNEFHVEADWSAAAFWYLAASMADEAEIKLNGLYKPSLQGDNMVADIYTFFGVHTEYTHNGIIITKKGKPVSDFALDFKEIPDLAPVVAINSALTGCYAILNGLKTLKIKETDRITALKTLIEKMGIQCESTSNDSLVIHHGFAKKTEDIFPVFKDHRLAMSLAMLAIGFGNITIENPECVEKSYPEFWEHLKNAGFEIEISN